MMSILTYQEIQKYLLQERKYAYMYTDR